MSKIIISSLFSYDILTHGLQNGIGLLSKSDDGQDADVRLDLIEGLYVPLRENVVKEIVNAVMLSVVKESPDTLILLLDSQLDPIQEESLIKLRDKLGEAVNIEPVRVAGNSPLDVAKAAVGQIESFNDNDEVCINIWSLKHCNSLGLLYAGYVRTSKISKMFYVNMGNRSVVLMPKVELKLTKNQRRILQEMYKAKLNLDGRPINRKEFCRMHDMDRKTYYYLLKTLKNLGLCDENNAITELGEVSLL